MTVDCRLRPTVGEAGDFGDSKYFVEVCGFTNSASSSLRRIAFNPDKTLSNAFVGFYVVQVFVSYVKKKTDDDLSSFGSVSACVKPALMRNYCPSQPIDTTLLFAF